MQVWVSKFNCLNPLLTKYHLPLHKWCLRGGQIWVRGTQIEPQCRMKTDVWQWFRRITDLDSGLGTVGLLRIKICSRWYTPSKLLGHTTKAVLTLEVELWRSTGTDTHQPIDGGYFFTVGNDLQVIQKVQAQAHADYHQFWNTITLKQ